MSATKTRLPLAQAEALALEVVAEEWRPFPQHPDYSISDLGRVRRDNAGHGGTAAGRLLSINWAGGDGKKGYPRVGLTTYGRIYSVGVNRAIVEAFVRPLLRNESVLPIDGDWRNVALSNWEIKPFSALVGHSWRARSNSRPLKQPPPTKPPKPAAFVSTARHSLASVAKTVTLKRKSAEPEAIRRYDPRDAEPDYGAPFRSGYAAYMEELALKRAGRW